MTNSKRASLSSIIWLTFALVLTACSESEDDPTKDGGGTGTEAGTKDSGGQPGKEDGMPSDTGGTTTLGTRFVYLDKDKKSVRGIAVDGCGVKDIYTIETDKDIGQISISPDGKWLFYGLSLDDGFLVELSNQANKITLTKPGAGEIYWAQDSSKLITGWHTYGGGQIFELPSGTPLFAEPQRIEHPSFIENNTKVLYTNSNAWIMDLSNQEASVVFEKCGRTTSTLDGKMMCYQFMSNKEWAIFFDKTGNETTKFELGEKMDIKPAQKPMVTPDGSKVIWGQREAGQINIYAINADGQGQKTKLISGSTQAAFMYPSWNGQHIAWADKLVSISDGTELCSIDKDAETAGAWTK